MRSLIWVFAGHTCNLVGNTVKLYRIPTCFLLKEPPSIHVPVSLQVQPGMWHHTFQVLTIWALSCRRDSLHCWFSSPRTWSHKISQNLPQGHLITTILHHYHAMTLNLYPRSQQNHTRTRNLQHKNDVNPWSAQQNCSRRPSIFFFFFFFFCQNRFHMKCQVLISLKNTTTTST